MKIRFKIVLGVLIIALLLFVGWKLTGGLIALLNGSLTQVSETDPMFAEEMSLPTRPPEPDETARPQRPTLNDYVPEVETPVDKTVEQLIEEAKARDGA